MLTKDTFPETPAWREFVKGLEPVIRRIGYEDGKTDGRLDGRAEGEAQALLAVLEARGLAVDDDTRARILACTDTARLHRWIKRAVTAPTAADALDGG